MASPTVTATVAGPIGTVGFDRKPRRERIALYVVILGPFLAVLAALPVAVHWGLTWDVVALTVVSYVVSMLGITVGYHRLFTHRSFRARRGLKIALAVAGSFGVQGPLVRWAADHRRHHAFSDRNGDPHSPWRYGTSVWALVKGMAFAHVGWMFDGKPADQARYVPDLLADPDLVRISRLFGPIAGLGLILPALGVLAAGAPAGRALTALLWAGLVRVFLVHHVTWSVNSVCHVVGARPFASRDRSANVWPLALLSMGESWHNGHHAMPSSARHGVVRGQLDISAATIALFERLGWVTDGHWPQRVARRSKSTMDGAGHRSAPRWRAPRRSVPRRR
jgi:stearoyl-CoA desaturase (Delta-9 desaturase)